MSPLSAGSCQVCGQRIEGREDNSTVRAEDVRTTIVAIAPVTSVAPILRYVPQKARGFGGPTMKKMTKDSALALINELMIDAPSGAEPWVYASCDDSVFGADAIYACESVTQVLDLLTYAEPWLFLEDDDAVRYGDAVARLEAIRREFGEVLTDSLMARLNDELRGQSQITWWGTGAEYLAEHEDET